MPIRLFCGTCNRPVVATLKQPMSSNPRPETAQCPLCGTTFDWPSVERAIQEAVYLSESTGQEWGTRP